MVFSDLYRLCDSTEVHVEGSFYFMTFKCSFIGRLYLFDFYLVDGRYYFSITCNGKSKYYQIDTTYFLSLSIAHLDYFCYEFVKIW